MPVGERNQSELLEELKEFASFTPAEQRYIRCSLEVSLASADAADHWARDLDEAATIGRQARAYCALQGIRSLVPTGLNPEDAVALLGLLVAISIFDLEQGKLSSFAAYRFLYERLIGPS